MSEPDQDQTKTDLSAAESGVLAAVRLGWVDIVGQDDHGRNVYRLTDAGRDHAARLLGVPPESIV